MKKLLNFILQWFEGGTDNFLGIDWDHVEKLAQKNNKKVKK